MARPLKSARIARRSAIVSALVAATLMTASVASSAPATSTPTRIVDNETVYVVASATGEPRTTVVVDWLQVQGTGRFELADPAPDIGEIESLTDGFEPRKEGDAVRATVDVEDYGDFFYRAETDAPLPLEVRVDYFLDGAQVQPDELAGKSGRLRMDIAITNRLERSQVVTFPNADGGEESREVTYTVPLLCIPQLAIDGTRMTGIVPPEGAQLAITGSTLTYAIPMVPSPEDTATIEMDARDIELAPMIVSAFPTLPASPDFSVTEEFAELRDGLSQLRQLSEGHLQVVQGMSAGMGAFDSSSIAGAGDGIASLQIGLGEMSSAASGLAQLAAGQYAYLDGMIAGIDTSQFASLPALVSAITTMRQSAAGLEGGTTDLLALIDSQIALVTQMQDLNFVALNDALVLSSRYPTDDEAAAIVGRLTALDTMYGQLLSTDAPGLPYLRTQLVGIRDGMTGLRAGLEAIEAQASGLAAVPSAFVQLKGALVVLRDGGDPDGAGPAPHMPGLGTTRDGLAGLAGGLTQATSGLAGSAAQLSMLQQVPTLMSQLKSTLDALSSGGTLQGRQLPGINTTISALGEMTSGMGDGIGDLREGEALTDAMKAAADAYTSFLGLPEGATGQLSFLFKLEGVSK
jgi:putative membrane protein